MQLTSGRKKGREKEKLGGEKEPGARLEEIPRSREKEGSE